MDHVRLGENGAAAGHVGRLLAFTSQLDEVHQYPVCLILGDINLSCIDGGGQALGLLVDE